MKVYWITSKSWGNCFFKLDKPSAQHECDMRMDEKNFVNIPLLHASPKGSWWVTEEEIPDEQFGYCRNGQPGMPAPALTLPTRSDCSVGKVRKMRNGVSAEEDNGKCSTCPYYSKEKPDLNEE